MVIQAMFAQNFVYCHCA